MEVAEDLKSSQYFQVAAAGSLAAGDITYDNVHKAVFGFNQGQEGRRLLDAATKVFILCTNALQSLLLRYYVISAVSGYTHY